MSICIEANYAVFPGGILEKGPLYVHISNGKLSRIQKQAPPDLHDCLRAHLITPGFIDIHTHGFGEPDQILNKYNNYHYNILPKEVQMK